MKNLKPFSTKKEINDYAGSKRRVYSEDYSIANRRLIRYSGAIKHSVADSLALIALRVFVCSAGMLF